MTDPDQLIRDLAACERAGFWLPLLGVVAILAASWAGAIMAWGVSHV